MKRKTFTNDQKASILKEHRAGRSIDDIIREHGVSQATFYRWRDQHGAAENKLVSRLNALETENRRLRAEVNGLTLDLRLAKEIIGKKP